MINTNSARLPFHNSTFANQAPHQNPSGFGEIQDTFIPSTSEQLMGLPDPRKYPQRHRPANIIGLADPSKYPQPHRPANIIGLADPSKYPQPNRPANIIGLADPSKYPGYSGNDLLGKDTQPHFVPDYNKYPRDKPGICGGWDAPMNHNGRVITRREYAQLFGG
jgi:hypothetical protein